MEQLNELPRTAPFAITEADGFTTTDLDLLSDTHSMGVAHKRWGRAHLVTTEFSHFLAIWDEGMAEDCPPCRSVIRFKKTGTYAMTVGTTIVASGKSLSDDILPVLAAGLS